MDGVEDQITHIELFPDLSHCVETRAKQEYAATMSRILSGEELPRLEKRLELLKEFLETADFGRLRRESEEHMIRGKMVKFVLSGSVGGDEWSVQMIVEDWHNLWGIMTMDIDPWFNSVRIGCMIAEHTEEGGTWKGLDMNETPHIRLAEEKDIPSILELYRELTITTSQVEQSRSPSLADYRKVFAEIQSDPRQELLVVEDRGDVVGTIVLLVVPNLSHNATPWALLENLIVTEARRGRGLGKMLLEHAVGRARQLECHMVELCSDLRRKEAHNLYRSMGFEAQAHCFRLYF
jgi:predicted N-acetyltransferase YhbS